MLKLMTKNLLTGEELRADEIAHLIDFGIELKKNRRSGETPPILKGKNLALVFDKPSLRTRFSFTVAMNELGGSAIESVSTTRKSEEPEDLIRVLAGYCDGVVIRTHDDRILERMADVSSVPIINGLTELHHPCQTLADLMTLKEVYGKPQGLTISYIGDGNNILHSLLLLAPLLKINIKYSCPFVFQPNTFILEKAGRRALEYGTRIAACKSPEEAVAQSHAVYTDVWTSMGFEKERSEREQAFAGYQVNEALMAKAEKGAVLMHCLPMERGKEVSQTLPDSPCSVIFQQSENRLHVQKALLISILG